MADRTDIDALLIGALYGELTPADEARLTAHLDSHPVDRNALADLTHTRAQVRASRLFQVQYDPPQSVSALLMQEAARRAPARVKDGESWLARLLRSLTAHPAMAAAMTLVLIVGVAGTLYVRRGVGEDSAATSDDRLRVASMAQPPVAAMRPEAPALSEATPVTPVTPPADPSGTAGGAAAAAPQAGRSPTVGADDGVAAGSATDAAALATAPAKVALDREQAMVQDLRSPAHHSAAAEDPAPKKPAAVAKQRARLEISTKELQPKDFDDKADANSVVGGNAPAQAPAVNDQAKNSYAKAPSKFKKTERRGDDDELDAVAPSPTPATAAAATPPPPPPAAAPAATAPGNAGPGGAASAGDKLAKSDSDWLQKQRAQVIAYVQANQCSAAASVAAQIYARSPAFYASNIEVDRSIKPCLAYVANERERVDRARAAKRAVDTDTGGSGSSTTPAAPAPAKRD